MSSEENDVNKQLDMIQNHQKLYGPVLRRALPRIDTVYERLSNNVLMYKYSKKLVERCLDQILKSGDFKLTMEEVIGLNDRITGGKSKKTRTHKKRSLKRKSKQRK